MATGLRAEQVRQHALDVAIANTRNGTKWELILGTAKKLEEYILNGTVPTEPEESKE